jgi:hypothetical protein
MKDKDIKSRTRAGKMDMTEADWTMLVALFLTIWLLMILRYLNI